MKEQQNEPIKQTLKNGLFNGLKWSANDLAIFNMDLEYGESGWERRPMTVQNVCVSLNKLEIEIANEDNSIGMIELEEVTPHLFPLEYLTKEIVIEGYNNNEPFVPRDWIVNNSFIGSSCFIDNAIGDNKWVNHLPKYIHDYLVKMKFNTEDVPPESFIDASESKVYEPKK